MERKLIIYGGLLIPISILFFLLASYILNQFFSSSKECQTVGRCNAFPLYSTYGPVLTVLLLVGFVVSLIGGIILLIKGVKSEGNRLN